jgi:hypothetical protein
MTRRADAEARRILDRYRRLILLGRLRVSPAAARRIVGPDCAYRVYFGSLKGVTARRLS